MSKEALRKQFDKIKAESELALADKSTPAHVRALFTSLISLFEIMITVFLEKKPRKTSSNSGLPPSHGFGSNGNRNTTTTDRQNVTNEVSNVRTIETEEIITPEDCRSCGADLSGEKVTGAESRVKIDIIYEVIHHTVTCEVKECKVCGEKNKGKFPESMNGPVQYGTSIKIMIIDFLCVQMMSLQRTQEHFQGLIKRVMSQANMLKYLLKFSESLKEWEARQVEAILKMKVIHCDETSVRINKILFWVHSYSFGDITLKFVHAKRGLEAIFDIGIIPRYGGIIIHDCWASYFKFKNVLHAICGAHILRELKFIEESDGYSWANIMKELLKEAAEIVRERPDKRIFTQDELKNLENEYRLILDIGLQEMPAFIDEEGDKISAKNTDAQNLWLRLKKYESSVLMFARVKEVDFTNNRAERDLRVAKTKQKNCGCFRTLEFARAFFRISSYIKSMRYKGYSSLEAISLAYNGKIPD
jgi:transposase